MTTPGPTPAASSMPSATPQAQSVQGNTQAFMPTNAGGGSAYFGTGQINPQLTEQEGHPVYGVYDPSALFAMQFAASGNGAPVYINVTNAANMYYNWNQSQQDQFRSRMALVDSNYLTATDAQLASAWANLVNQSAAYGAAGQNLTPWDILAKDIASNNGGTGRQGKDFTRTITTQSFTSAADANAVFTAAAQSLLGRAPTADELTNFRNNLHGLEAANPLVKTVNYHYLPGQSFYPTEDITAQSGGVSQAAQQNLALQQAKTNPEYGAYQAATTYMGALQELLSGGKV